MSRSLSLLRSRPLWAGTGLVALSAALVSIHAPEDTGMTAEGMTPGYFEQVRAELVAEGTDPAALTTGRWILDLVEPEEGEGDGVTEGELSEWVHDLDARADLDVTAAGFYSEGEHLYRMEGSPEAIEQALEEGGQSRWIEGFEPEILVQLPGDPQSLTAGPTEVTPNKPSPDRFSPNDPMFALQWHMDQIHAPEAWTKTRGKGAIVAVIDTGVAWKDGHGVKQVPDLAATRFVDGETFVSGATPEGLDDHAHGTHVAGTIAQSTHNGIGVTGVAHEATIMPLKVLSARGSGSVPGIANAIRYAADHGAHVINMSLGSPLPSKVLAKAIEYAHERGVTVVAASGNEHRSRVGYPAASAHTIAVGAVDFAGAPTFYTNWGKNLDVVAPGGDTRADKNGDGHPDGVLQNSIQIQKPLENDYLWFQGTSMASPHAAGVAALIVASGVTNPDEVEAVMKSTARHPQGASWDEVYGAGIINAHDAVAAARNRYAPERAGFLGLLGLMGLAGLGAAGQASRRGRVWAAGGLVAGGVLASGAVGFAPMAEVMSSAGVASGFVSLGSPLLYSAALPMVATVLLLGVRPIRGLLAGIHWGYAAFLAHGAVVLPTLLLDLPGGTMVDRLWLALNAVVCLVVARRIAKL